MNPHRESAGARLQTKADDLELDGPSSEGRSRVALFYVRHADRLADAMAVTVQG